MDLTDKNQLLDYLKQYGLWTNKGLGQNFLVDRVALEKIIEAAEIKSDDYIVEIGPGVGTLTEELVKKAGEVLSVEIDTKLAQLLNCYIVKLLGGLSNIAIEQYNNNKFEIINADILKLNLNEIIKDKPYKVVANIPYYITSKIISLFLSREHKPELIVLLVQKEVAERICAKPGDMSVLAVSVQLYGKPEIVDIVPKESFFPSPKVDSAILKVDRIQNTDNSFDEKKFFRTVHIGFAARRKTLLNNLMVGYQLDRNKVLDILNKMGLSENVRAQELSIEKWKELEELINC